MRKVICLLTALLLCMSMLVPAFAAEEGFVPSITYKPNPEVVPVTGEDGKGYCGVIRDANGKVIDYIDHACLRITPIAHVWDEEIDVPKEIEDLLLLVYNGLNEGSLKVDYTKHKADLDPSQMVIRDLFDVRWACEDHAKMVEEAGIVLELTFDLGVLSDAQVYAQTYDENGKQFGPIISAENNGDGTVTCVFEHLCVVEFSMLVSAKAGSGSAAGASRPDVMPWVALLSVAVAAAVGVVVVGKKKVM